jgi:hypothetical protein
MAHTVAGIIGRTLYAGGDNPGRRTDISTFSVYDVLKSPSINVDSFCGLSEIAGMSGRS